MVRSQVWDDNMGYRLGPAVHGYEQERVFGACFGNEDFQDAIQGAVPERQGLGHSDVVGDSTWIS